MFKKNRCARFWIFDFHDWSYYNKDSNLIKSPSKDTLDENSYRICGTCKLREEAIKEYYWPSFYDDNFTKIEVLSGTNYLFKFKETQ